MPLLPLTAIPPTIEAGDTVIFSEEFSQYAGWAATLVFNRPGSTVLTFAGSTSGGKFSWTLTTAQTATIGIGRWMYAIYVTDGTQRATAKTGYIGILQNLAVDAVKTFAQIALANLESAITALSQTTNSEATVNGSTYRKVDLANMLKQRVQLRAEVYREQQEQAALRGTAQSGFVSVRFAPQAPQNAFDSGWTPLP